MKDIDNGLSKDMDKELSRGTDSRLSKSIDNRLSAEEISSALSEAGITDCSIQVYDTVGSTQDIGKEFARAQWSDPEGTSPFALITADSQTKGRGRYGKHFYSPSDTGIYMSLVIKVGKPVENFLSITTATAVAVCHVIERHSHMKPEIKWVNDLYVRGKKVCGILTEAAIEFESKKTDYMVVGIGINLSDAGISSELKETAGGIVPAGVRPPQRCRLIAEILNRMEEMLNDLSTKNFLPEYRRRSNVLGQRVTILRNGLPCGTGLAVDIDEQARLAVRLDNGETEHLNSGEISCKILP